MTWTKTKLTRLLKLPYPIVQGPFGGTYSSVALTAAVSNLGGLGGFGAQAYTYDEIVGYINAIRQKTDKPFAINLWVSDRDTNLLSFDKQAYSQLVEIFKPYFDKFGVPIPEQPTDFGPGFDEQVQAVLDARPPVFSFVYGIPSPDILEKCRQNDIITIGAATTADEAIAIEKAGVDAVVATGFEAGGHRVSFLRPAEESLTGLFSLIPQVADSVSIPVIAAGGIADGRGIKAALTLGADAVQIGTAFLATQQSNAPVVHKQKLFSPEARFTTLTRLFTGRLARSIKGPLTDELKAWENNMAPFPLQSSFLGSLRKSLLEKGETGYMALWSGQSAPLIKYTDAEDLFRTLVEQTNRLYSTV